MPKRLPIPLDAIIRPSREQVYTQFDNEMVILSLTNGVYYGLNPVAARVWELIQEGASLGDVCRALSSEYEVDPDQCEEDVTSLVVDLRERSLVELVERD